jgi:hypothetical protein
MNRGRRQLVLGAPSGRWTTVFGSGDTNWLDFGLSPPKYLDSTRSSWERREQRLRMICFLAFLRVLVLEERLTFRSCPEVLGWRCDLILKTSSWQPTFKMRPFILVGEWGDKKKRKLRV